MAAVMRSVDNNYTVGYRNEPDFMNQLYGTVEETFCK